MNVIKQTKNYLILLICAAMLLAIYGCGKNEPPVESSPEVDYDLWWNATPTPAEPEKQEVSITVGQTYFLNERGEADIEAYFGEPSSLYSYELNDEDQTVTINMTQGAYDTFLSAIYDSVYASLAELIEGANTPYVVSAFSNGDFSEIDIYVDYDAYKLIEKDYAPDIAGAAALVYQNFSTSGIVGCTVNVIDSETEIALSTFKFPTSETTDPGNSEAVDDEVPWWNLPPS